MELKISEYAKQAIIQALGTIPTQVNWMEELTEKEKDAVKYTAYMQVIHLLKDTGITQLEIDNYWGGNE